MGRLVRHIAWEDDKPVLDDLEPGWCKECTWENHIYVYHFAGDWCPKDLKHPLNIMMEHLSQNEPTGHPYVNWKGAIARGFWTLKNRGYKIIGPDGTEYPLNLDY